MSRFTVPEDLEVAMDLKDPLDKWLLSLGKG